MAAKKRQVAKAAKAQAQPTTEAPTSPKGQTRSSRAKAAQTQSAQPAASQPAGSVPSAPKVRYSDEELEMFRQIVLKEKQKTLEELRLLRERLEDLNSFNYIEEGGIFALHPAEQGAEAWERERTYAQIQRLTAYLQKLDEALKRIDNKTYGICRKCGILIAKERLMAVPITTLSASWKIHHRCPEDGVDRIIPLHAAKALQE
jgi:RNA polymerase-binding transcription factor DksA